MAESTPKRLTSFRSSLLLRMVVVTLVTSGTILLASFAIGARESVELRSHGLVENGTQATVEALQRVFGQVAQNLRVARGWGQLGMLDPHDVEGLNRLFRPHLSEHAQVSSMLIANGRGHEWMLLQEGETYRNRLSRPDSWGRTTRWMHWDARGQLLDDSTRELDYDARKRPWYRGAMSVPPGTVHWTAPYTFFTTKDPGITASIRFSTPDGRQRVVAFDVQLRDISRFTTGIRVAKHGAVLVLSADDRVVGLPGLPRFREPAAMAAAVLQPATSLGLPWIEDALAQARQPATDSTQFFSTGHGRGEHWVGVRSFESGSGELFKVIAFVPRADLHEELQDWRMAVAGATVLALLISFTLAARSAGSYSRPLLRLSEAATRVRELGADAEEGRAPGQRRSVSSLAELEEAEDWEERFAVDRIGISGIAEIDSLTRSFEHMARSLSQKAGELADYSRTLEDKVFTRTNDLREKNSTLRATLEQVREMQQQLVLREKMAALGDLVAGVAHEVNNPVGAIASASQNIELCIQKLEQAGAEGPVGAVQMGKLLRLMRTNAKVISEGSGRVTELVKSLRRFSRIDGAEWQEADLHEGLESTLTLVQHLLKDRVQVERDFGELPPIVCNSGQLNQVFMNLIVNASQAIEGPGRIRITTRHENEEVTITVEDDGKGIPQEVQGHLFEPGFTTKGVGVGTGLGLSIAYRIVHEHRGEIEVESSEGAGATFRVRLPVAPPQGA